MKVQRAWVQMASICGKYMLRAREDDGRKGEVGAAIREGIMMYFQMLFSISGGKPAPYD